MPGIFDSLFSDENAANLALAAGLLGGKGSFNQVVGQALTQGQAAATAATQRKRQAELDALTKQRFQLALDEEQRKKQQYQALEQFRASIPEPTALAGVDWAKGPTPAAASQVTPIDPLAKLSYSGMKAGAIDPMEWLKSQQKDKTPIKVDAGGSLVIPGPGGTFKEAYRAAEKPTTELQQYEYARSRGEPGTETFTGWMQAQKKAGASNTNVKIENALGGGIAKEIGPMAAASAQQANGAIQQLQTSDQIIKAVDSNTVLSGPGATFKLRGLQIGQVLGVGGKDASESISNTRSVIQGLAQATVAARGALKGQGQVSDFEGRLLEKAASGNIDDMTADEIRQVAVVNKRLSNQLIGQHKKFIGKIAEHKDPAISGLAQFFDINAPEAPVRTYNPKTGQLE
jgi:hypothetical protein